jgi:uncharacterized protein (DUF58 family)
VAPYLTGAGRAILATALLLLAVGVVAGHWPLVLLGGVLVSVLGLCWYALLAPALVLERRLLGMEVVTPEGVVTDSLRAGRPMSLRLNIRNRGGATLRGLELLPHMGTGLRVVEQVPGPIRLPGHTATDTDVTLVAEEAGRWFLHGFRVTVRGALGLVAVGEYVATPVPLKFLPDIGSVRTGALRTLRKGARDREGLHMVRRSGSGADLRELRDHQHGDPFRAIAWKATARTGRLMVKEYESELVLNSYVCVDISSTMRGGRRSVKAGEHGPGSKLDHAVELAGTYADTVLSRGDRVGLITFDERIYGHMRARDGRSQLGQLLQHLVGVRHVVDEDLTEYGDGELVELVARYLAVQERLDFRRKDPVPRHRGVGQGMDYWAFSREVKEAPEVTPYDGERLEAWIRAVLPYEKERFDDRALTAGVLGTENVGLLRRFCQLRGIEVPYRLETRLGQKERGLVQCLEEILTQSRDPTLVLVVSDLCGIMNTELIVRALRLVKAKRHKVAFVSPFTPDYVDKPVGPGRAAVLHELFALAETDDRHHVIRAVESLGVPVLTIGPEESMASIARRLRHFGWR